MLTRTQFNLIFDTVKQLYASQTHEHKCSSCGTIWEHGNCSSLGDVNAHTCPQCGQVEWDKHNTPSTLSKKVEGVVLDT